MCMCPYVKLKLCYLAMEKQCIFSWRCVMWFSHFCHHLISNQIGICILANNYFTLCIHIITQFRKFPWWIYGLWKLALVFLPFPYKSSCGIPEQTWNPGSALHVSHPCFVLLSIYPHISLSLHYDLLSNFMLKKNTGHHNVSIGWLDDDGIVWSYWCSMYCM